MPKHVFKISSSAANEELDDSNFYAGDTPPNGVYDAILKKLWLKETNDKSNEAFSCLFEIREPKSSGKAKYNGAGVFDWLNLTDAGAPFVNRFLAAFGLPKISNLNGFVTDDENPPNVTKLGTKRVTGEWPCRVATKIDDRGNAKVVRVLPAEDRDDEDDAADETGDPLDGVSLDAGDDDAAVEEGAYTEDELNALDIDDLRAIAKELELDVKPAARTATLIAAIIEYQEAAEGDEGAPEDPDVDVADAVDGVSADELGEMPIGDVKEYADELGVEYPPKATKSKIIALILEATQGSPEEEVAEEVAEGSDAITEEDLNEMEIQDLKDYLTETLGGTLPKPPLKRKVIEAILAAQDAADSEPPF